MSSRRPKERGRLVARHLKSRPAALGGTAANPDRMRIPERFGTFPIQADTAPDRRRVADATHQMCVEYEEGLAAVSADLADGCTDLSGIKSRVAQSALQEMREAIGDLRALLLEAIGAARTLQRFDDAALLRSVLLRCEPSFQGLSCSR